MKKKVVSPVMYGGETWGVRMNQRHKLGVIGVKYLRIMCEVTRKNRCKIIQNVLLCSCFPLRKSRNILIPIEDTSYSLHCAGIPQILLRQAPPSPVRGAERWVEGGWWWCSTLITLCYTCNLIAVLTIPVFPEKLATIAQLADSPFR